MIFHFSDESESSNKILTRQLEWYKKGWLTFHEFAREEMNKNEKVIVFHFSFNDSIRSGRESSRSRFYFDAT